MVINDYLVEYYDYMHKVALKKTRSEERAEDLVAKVFLRLYNKDINYDERQQFKTYITTIIFNQSISDNRIKTSHLNQKFVYYTSDNSNIDIEDESDYQEEDFVELIKKLCKKKYTKYYNLKNNIILDYYFKGYKYHEIAEKMNIPEQTIKNVMLAIRKFIKPYAIAYKNGKY